MIHASNVQLPEPLAKEAETAAKAARESMEVFVMRAVTFEIERERKGKFFAERHTRADVAKALDLLDCRGGEPPQPGD